MTTVILAGLIVVLLTAAACVGVLLMRRTRSARAEPEPDAAAERPRTVAELVKRRAATDQPDAEGDDLVVPAVARQDGVAVPATADGSAAEPVGATAAAPQPATPAGGLEIGDAPWRRAARMSGAEPGGSWETAPIPVVAEPVRAGEAPAAPEARAGETAGPAPSPSSGLVIVSRAATAAATVWQELDAMRAAVRTDPAASERQPEQALARPEAPSPDIEPAAAVQETEVAEPEVVQPTVSRPLSDPDLTPLIGIPMIRPAVEPAVADPAEEPAADVPDALPVAAPPRTTATSAPDDDDIVLLPPTGALPVLAPPASGSPQPVWFRVVRRDGEPVCAAVVALLDDHGREVDTTKTATDGGGELRTPHGGRFLMVVSADGYQPRAAMIAVDEEPVELALLLPRSAAVSGSVRAGGATVRDARVVVRQHHDVVDEASTAGDGHYRFDDLAEGAYTVAATAAPGEDVARVSLAEGADVRVDLDLR